MIRRLFAAAALCLCLPPLALAEGAQFKGWSAISRELSTRLAKPGIPLDLDQFMPAEDVDGLLGTWNGFGDEHSFKNGAPNSVNMMIWRVALSGFAKSVAASCKSPQLEFGAPFLATLRELCAWPAAAAKSEDVLQAYWFAVMGYNAPESEYRAWRDFFLGASYRDRPAAETIDAMTFAITMNPYFLLQP
ncbi:MAG TPA: hypothetical protein VIF14_15910 [Alphaproteobacteria bacterium]|jgi:hypothetical protein